MQTRALNLYSKGDSRQRNLNGCDGNFVDAFTSSRKEETNLRTSGGPYAETLALADQSAPAPPGDAIEILMLGVSSSGTITVTANSGTPIIRFKDMILSHHLMPQGAGLVRNVTGEVGAGVEGKGEGERWNIFVG